MQGQCKGTNRDGQPCSGWVPAGRDFCLWHDPDRGEERRRMRQAGGAARSNKRRAEKQLVDAELTMPEIAGLLSVAMRAVLSGKLEPGRAQAMASLARAIAVVKETGELEERLASLEERAGERGTA